MNPFTTPDRILISTRPQDMRAGINRLCQVVVAELGCDPADGTLFVFVSRDCRKVKMLRFETSAWCMWYVTLATGTFSWEWGRDGPCLVAERRQLLWLLEGLSIDQPGAPERVTARCVV